MLADTLNKIASYELMEAPIGGGVTLAIADAIGKSLMEIVKGFVGIPEIALGIGLSILDRRYLRLERYLGEKMDALINLSLCRTAIDSQFDLTGKVEELVGKIIPKGSSQTTSGIEGVDFGSIGDVSFDTSFGEIGSEPVTSIGYEPSTFETGSSMKAADVLELRKKRIKAYTE